MTFARCRPRNPPPLPHSFGSGITMWAIGDAQQSRDNVNRLALLIQRNLIENTCGEIRHRARPQRVSLIDQAASEGEVPWLPFLGSRLPKGDPLGSCWQSGRLAKSQRDLDLNI